MDPLAMPRPLPSAQEIERCLTRLDDLATRDAEHSRHLTTRLPETPPSDRAAGHRLLTAVRTVRRPGSPRRTAAPPSHTLPPIC